MGRATKWLVFLVILAMTAAAMLTAPAAVLAEEEQASAATESGGIIEALVWDDFKSPDGQYTVDDLVDGVRVTLYYLKDKALVTDPEAPYLFSLESTNIFGGKVVDKWTGEWVPQGTKVTGPGGFAQGQDNALTEYEHGWVGWSGLALDSWCDNTFYMLRLDPQGPFKPLDGGERIAQLNPSNWHVKQYFPGTFQDTPPFEIQSAAATICGTVWSDANADMVKQWAERPLADAAVVLTNRYGSRIATASTNRYGYFYFCGLQPGTYNVWVMSKRGFRQVAPYYKLFTLPPHGCEKGHYSISAAKGKYYQTSNFGFLDMKDSVWATLYYGLWWIGLLQYQFKF